MAAATAPSITSKQSQDITEITHWINNAPVKGTSGRFSDVFHPTHGRVQSRVPLAGDAEVDAAVQAAAKAFLGSGGVEEDSAARGVAAEKRALRTFENLDIRQIEHHPRAARHTAADGRRDGNVVEIGDDRLN